MASLCKTCKNFMLIKIVSYSAQHDLIRRRCLVSEYILEDLNVGHITTDEGKSTGIPNVVSCTHYKEKIIEERENYAKMSKRS